MESQLSKAEKQTYIDNLVQNLPLLRKRLGLTQAELAQRVGTTRPTLTAIETGQRPLSWANYLSFILVFQSNPPTKILLDALDIFPQIVRSYLLFDKK